MAILNPLTNYNNSEFSPKQTSGTAIGGTLGFAFVAGFSISAGVVTDAVGSSKGYFTFSGNIGFGLSASVDVIGMKPTGTNQFLTGDFKGSSGSYSEGAFFLGANQGGSIKPGLGAAQMLPKNFGSNKGGYTTGGVSGSLGLDFGFMFSHGETWVGK
jgi:hypothetical protein